MDVKSTGNVFSAQFTFVNWEEIWVSVSLLKGFHWFAIEYRRKMKIEEIQSEK